MSLGFILLEGKKSGGFGGVCGDGVRGCSYSDSSCTRVGQRGGEGVSE